MRLPEADCRSRFAAARRACLATTTRDAVPHLVPVTFALDEERIFTMVDVKPKSTMQLKRLRNIRDNPSVTLLADHYDEDWSRLWWVRVDGTATVVEDPGDQDYQQALALLRGKYEQYRGISPGGPAIRVDIADWTGWAYTSS